jgi:Na+/H+ antiporter NhaD/arsenite permease-like protein
MATGILKSRWKSYVEEHQWSFVRFFAGVVIILEGLRIKDGLLIIPLYLDSIIETAIMSLSMSSHVNTQYPPNLCREDY